MCRRCFLSPNDESFNISLAGMLQHIESESVGTILAKNDHSLLRYLEKYNSDSPEQQKVALSSFARSCGTLSLLPLVLLRLHASTVSPVFLAVSIWFPDRCNLVVVLSRTYLGWEIVTWTIYCFKRTVRDGHLRGGFFIIHFFWIGFEALFS